MATNKIGSFLRQIVFALSLFTAFALSAQERTIIMPHHGTDTLVLSSDSCYTILDPGGSRNYDHNEDSWLVIDASAVGTYHLEIEYETGHYDDNGDNLWVYYLLDTTSSGWNSRFCGTGRSTADMYWGSSVLHFKSNSYASYGGYTIRIVYSPVIDTYSETLLLDTVATLNWVSHSGVGTQWTVYYLCEDDSIQSTTVSTPSATLTGLKKNTYYRYWIEELESPCRRLEYRYFHTGCDNGVVLTPMYRNGNTEILYPKHCDTLYAITGPQGKRLSDVNISGSLQTQDSVGCYLEGTFQLRAEGQDYFSISNLNRQWWYWGNPNTQCKYYFPKGHVDIDGRTLNHLKFSIKLENSNYVRPTVSSITPTSATITWLDSSHATAWDFRYASTEGEWTSMHVTTPTVSLSGLTPGKQYIYTIEGNDPALSCIVPSRHAFITTGDDHVILLPYRSTDTVILNPGECYQVFDPGGEEGSYFNTDNSSVVLRTASGNGFRLFGELSLYGDDRIMITDGHESREWGSYNNYCEFISSTGQATISLETDVATVRSGFRFHVQQIDTVITNIHTTGVTANTASLAWTDNASSTSWTVYYGFHEDSIQSITTTSPSVTLTGLRGGTQYIYWVKSNLTSNDSCTRSDKHAFITTGVPANHYYMPFRGSDTIYVTPSSCITIWDGGGPDHDYFSGDTAELILISTDASNFNVHGAFFANNDEYEQMTMGYDGSDVISFNTDITDPNASYGYYHGWYSVKNRAYININSDGGFLRLRFTTNGRRVKSGFRFTVSRDNEDITNVQFPKVYTTTADVSWDDNSSATSWTVSYGPAGGSHQTINTTSKSCHLTGLAPNTLYDVRITNASSSSFCSQKSYTFNTLDASSIVMRSHSNDTIYITPNNCYYIYDPGGAGDYFANDTCSLTLLSLNGEGFYMNGELRVGASDYSDQIEVDPSFGWTSYWWSNEAWCYDGRATIRLRTNEAFQDLGFVYKVTFFPTIKNPDTLNRTDNSLTLVWQDTSVATSWTVSYGPDIDSMVTVTTSTRSVNLTGLRRNQQYLYRIENNYTHPDCVFPSYYGFIMPYDDDIRISQYFNYNLSRTGRTPLYAQPFYDLTSTNCVNIYDEGGFNRDFPNSGGGGTTYRSSDGSGLTLTGSFDLGEGSMAVTADGITHWYSGNGQLNTYSQEGAIAIETITGNDASSLGNGYQFQVHVNYPIYDIHTTSVTCNEAYLAWNDSSAATQWTLVYGVSERTLDTVVATSKSYHLTSLIPDQQYICYISNNVATSGCMSPVKYAFITTCDTHIIVMPYRQDTNRVININDCYTIKDPGADNDYFYTDRLVMNLSSNTGDRFVLRGWVHLGENDNLYITDNNTGEWLFNGSNSENIKIQTGSGSIRFEFVSGGDTMIAPGFEFQVSFNAITNIQTSLMTDSTCRVTWEDHSSGTEWVFWYAKEGDPFDSIVCHGKVAHLEDLDPGVIYNVFITNNAVNCIDTTWFSFCSGGDRCIDYANLYSCHTSCSYGRFYNPDEYSGVIDFGPSDIFSRHTVVTDTTATDPRTGNQLKCVPTGFDASVRLGNWDIGGQAESIVYEYIVDTTNSDILLLRYAAVMEEPGHSPANQPRFRFSLVDESGSEINPSCFSVDFVASQELGWNQYIYDTTLVLWKDWTAVGIDISSLQGRRIFVKLTTYDCAEMGHFAYAYYTIECQHKYMHAGACGEVVENDFTLPEGFNYEWYNVDSADVILSTSRTYSSNQPGIYMGRASFVGQTNSSCYFEKMAVVGAVYPYAKFDYRVVDTNGCNVAIKFYNQSVVALDSLRQNLSQMECESFMWVFPDGDTCYDRHPTRIFAPGYVDVRLYAYMGGGNCVDDTTFRILVPSPCIAYDTVNHVMCQGDTLVVRDSIFTTTGDYVLRIEHRADSITETFIHLTVNPTFDTSYTAGICNGMPYTAFGFNESVPGDYVKPYTTVHGCDSIYRAHLVLAYSHDTCFTANVCDNVGYWLDGQTIFIDTLIFQQSTTILGCDSNMSIDLRIRPSYATNNDMAICQGDSLLFGGRYFSADTIVTDSLLSVYLCDSVETLSLVVNPVYERYDTVLICQNEYFLLHGISYQPPCIIHDTLSTVWGCDSIIHYTVNYYDSLFHAEAQVSIDGLNWYSNDTIFEGCEPLTLQFRHFSVGHSRVYWEFGDGEQSYLSSPEHTYQAGLYTLLFIAESPDNCRDTVVFPNAINVLANPIADFTWTPDIPPAESNPEFQFFNLSNPSDEARSCLWNFYNDTVGSALADTSTASNPMHSWADVAENPAGEYLVQLIAYYANIGLRGDTLVCSDTAQKHVIVTRILLQFPNMVTPNGDGINDVWRIQNLVEFDNYKSNHLVIYNRWGGVVHERRNVRFDTDFWDPNERNCPDGTYFFIFKGTGDYGSVERKGSIEVLRN